MIETLGIVALHLQHQSGTGIGNRHVFSGGGLHLSAANLGLYFIAGGGGIWFPKINLRAGTQALIPTGPLQGAGFMALGVAAGRAGVEEAAEGERCFCRPGR